MWVDDNMAAEREGWAAMHDEHPALGRESCQFPVETSSSRAKGRAGR
jgi:hypothetical protein